MGHIHVGILDWECMACCFTSHLSYILAIFSLCIICSVPSPFHHPHVSTYYRNTEIVHLVQQKSHEHHVAVNSRCLKASIPCSPSSWNTNWRKQKNVTGVGEHAMLHCWVKNAFCWKQAATTYEKLSGLRVQLERKKINSDSLPC